MFKYTSDNNYIDSELSKRLNIDVFVESFIFKND